MIKQKKSKNIYNTMKIVKPYKSIKNQKITAEQHTDFVGGQA